MATITSRRRAHSATEVQIFLFVIKINSIVFFQIHKPVHIIGQSRVDTWQTLGKTSNALF